MQILPHFAVCNDVLSKVTPITESKGIWIEVFECYTCRYERNMVKRPL